MSGFRAGVSLRTLSTVQWGADIESASASWPLAVEVSGDPGAPTFSFPNSWTHYCALTIQASQVPGSTDLTDFPVLLTEANLPADFLDATQGWELTGGDIAFSSDAAGATRLACEVVSISMTPGATGASCEIYVKVPTVGATSDTTIYMWRSTVGGMQQPDASASYGRNETWTNYLCVWHGDTGEDATGNGHRLTAYGTARYAYAEAAKVGRAFHAPGASGAYFECQSFPDILNFGARSLTMYARPTAFAGPDYNKFFGNNAWEFGTQNLGANWHHATPAFRDAWAATGATVNTWHHIAATWDGVDDYTGTKTYVDGSELAHSAENDYGAPVTETTGFVLGRNHASKWYTGQHDEVRVAASVWSADWINAERNSTNAPGSFITAGSVQENSRGGGGPLSASASLISSGQKAASSAAPLASSATLTSTGQKATSTGFETTASASHTIGVQKSALSGGPLSASASHTADGAASSANFSGAAPLSAASSIASGGYKGAQDNALLTSSSGAVAQGQKSAFGAASINANAGPIAGALKSATSGASLSAIASNTADGDSSSVTGGAPIDAAGGITSGGEKGASGQAPLSAVGGVTAGGQNGAGIRGRLVRRPYRPKPIEDLKPLPENAPIAAIAETYEAVRAIHAPLPSALLRALAVDAAKEAPTAEIVDWRAAAKRAGGLKVIIAEINRAVIAEQERREEKEKAEIEQRRLMLIRRAQSLSSVTRAATALANAYVKMKGAA